MKLWFCKTTELARSDWHEKQDGCSNPNRRTEEQRAPAPDEPPDPFIAGRGWRGFNGRLILDYFCLHMNNLTIVMFIWSNYKKNAAKLESISPL
jgi:hypothetical protein